MSVEHPNKILAHEPQEPFPKYFKMVFWALTAYLAVVFLKVGSHFVLHGGSH